MILYQFENVELIFDVIDNQFMKKLNEMKSTDWILPYFHRAPSLSSKPLQKSDNLSVRTRITTDLTYSSKIRFLEVKIELNNIGKNEESIVSLGKKLLDMFHNLQSFLLHFYFRDKQSLQVSAFINLSKNIELLQVDQIFEGYEIELLHNYLQFVTKEQRTIYRYKHFW